MVLIWYIPTTQRLTPFCWVGGKCSTVWVEFESSKICGESFGFDRYVYICWLENGPRPWHSPGKMRMFHDYVSLPKGRCHSLF